MYLDADGTTDESIVGLASGVPGAVAGMVAALAKYGTMSLAQVMAPAIRLARDGFVVDTALFTSISRSRGLLTTFRRRKRVFLPGDSAAAGRTTLRQPALARTLRRDRARRRRGVLPRLDRRLLVAEMQRGGGIITKADLAKYTPRWREPLICTYRGYTLLAMPPSSSGGVTMTETLNILEHAADDAGVRQRAVRCTWSAARTSARSSIATASSATRRS